MPGMIPQHKLTTFSTPGSIVTLAFWRWRQTGFLSLITTIGMIIAVIMICAIPLFSNVMTTAGLRNVLRESPTRAEIELDTGAEGLSTGVVNSIHAQLDQLFKQNLGNLASLSQLSLSVSDFSFATPSPKEPIRHLSIYSTPWQQAAPHFGPVQGQLSSPKTNNQENSLDIYITPATAQHLHLQSGSALKLFLSYYPKQPITSFSGKVTLKQTITVNAHVAGIFTITPPNSAFWRGNDFNPLQTQADDHTYYDYTLFAPLESLLALFDHLRPPSANAIFSASEVYSLSWYYRLDTAHVQARISIPSSSSWQNCKQATPCTTAFSMRAWTC